MILMMAPANIVGAFYLISILFRKTAESIDRLPLYEEPYRLRQNQQSQVL